MSTPVFESLTPADREALLARIVTASLDAIVTIDGRGRVVEFNPAAVALFGYRREQAIGTLLSELLVPHEHRAAHEAGRARYLATGESRILGHRVQLEALRANGTRVSVELEVIALPCAGEVYFTAFVRDVGARLEAQQAVLEARERSEASSEAKSRFLASMSHELRTPLTAIMGFADLLERGSGSAAQRASWPREIQTHAQHLLALLNDLLDLSKLEADEVGLEPVEANVLVLVLEVVGLMGPLANKEGLDFHWECDPFLPRRVQLDPLRFKQILVNLLGNAIKFTPEGEVRLRIGTSRDGNELQVVVSDSGVGIPAERVEAIFERFVQAHGELAGRQRGTGLGLEISRRLATLLGGRLEVESEVGVGSSFTLSLPCRAADLVSLEELRAENEGRATRAFSRQALIGLRVLIADDHPSLRSLFRVLLEEQGAQVVEAEDGRAAVEAALAARAEGSPFHVACFDMQMPRLDGAGAVRELRQRGETLPVVALTAHSMEGDRSTCLAAGCDAYLSKPIRPELLIETIAELAGRAQLRLPPAREAPPGLELRVDPRLLALAERFRASLPGLLGEVEAALAGGDAEGVRAHAHRLAGVAGSYGFTALGDQARAVDAALRSELSLSAIPLPLRGLCEALERASKASLVPKS